MTEVLQAPNLIDETEPRTPWIHFAASSPTRGVFYPSGAEFCFERAWDNAELQHFDSEQKREVDGRHFHSVSIDMSELGGIAQAFALAEHLRGLNNEKVWVNIILFTWDDETSITHSVNLI